MNLAKVQNLLRMPGQTLSTPRAGGILSRHFSAVRMSLVSIALAILFAGLVPKTSDAVQSQALTITLTPRDQYTPGAITDLETAPSSTEEGQVLLIWTAPDEDNRATPAATPVQNYTVRYATFSVPDLGGNTTSWFNNAANLSGVPAPPQAQGEQESMMVTGLEPGVTYYFGVKSQDDGGNVSVIDLNAQNGPQAQALTLDLAPPVVTGFNVNESTDSLTLIWNPSTATDVTSYRIYWDTATPADVFTATVTVPFGTNSYTFNNLTIQNTYFFYITALDKGLPTYLGNALESASSAVRSGIPGNTPPLAPSNFLASAISTGSVLWEWLDNASNENGFHIYTSSGGLVGTVGFSAGSGATAQFTESNLVPNTLYSRYVQAFNNVGESSATAVSSRYTLARAPTGSAFTDVQSTSITISWSANGNSGGTNYTVEYTTSAGFAPTQTGSTTNSAAVLANLLSNATYYLRVKAINGENVSTAYDTTLTTKTPSAGILGLFATGGNRSVTLEWQDNTDFNLAGYFVYRATDFTGPFAKVNLTAAASSYYFDSGLTNGVTYYYRVTTVDQLGEESAFSNTVFARAAKPVTQRPFEPTGLLGTLTSTGSFTMRWTPVTMDIVRSTYVELAGYRIYKSTAMEGPYDLRDVVPPTINTWTSPDLVPPIVWYLVRAVDTSDNESAESMSIQTIATQYLAGSSADKTAFILFPAAEAANFSATTNGGAAEDLRLVINRMDNEEQGQILSSYDVRAFGAISNTELKDLRVSKPNVELIFRYLQGTAGAPLPASTKLRTLSSAFSYSPTDVGIFYNAGVEYIKFGGAVNEAKGTVSVKTAKPLGRYQVRQVARANEFTLTGLTPRKIFTPNGDGVNDDITLMLENPKDSIVSQAKIFDITGAEVADFQQGMVAGALGITSLRWDGKGRDGETVRSGVYIYQIQSEGKIINGSIVVAK